MAPHGEALVSSYSRPAAAKPPRLSTDSLHRTVSDISFEVAKESLDLDLPPISEVLDAKCECCGMSEEFTPEYIDKVREKFMGKWVCGLCAEAVKEEAGKTGGKTEEALNTHMSACFRFNQFGRAYPVLSQAQAMREILKKSSRVRAKSASPRDHKAAGGIARSSSCIPAITRGINEMEISN